jgi:hypothetical protein
MIAYCFAEVPGYSAIGSYTGNGRLMGHLFTQDSDLLCMIKRTDQVLMELNWMVYDAPRETIQYVIPKFYANISKRCKRRRTAETNVAIDIVSNGFKIEW